MSNQVFCNLESGVCEVNLDINMEGYIYKPPIIKERVLVEYFSDPLCPACFVLEPALFELLAVYGESIDFRVIMGGMLPSVEYDADLIKQTQTSWYEIGELFNMPLSDKSLNDPANSSYPASLAYLAAKKQDLDKANLYLRKLREAVFVLGLNISKEAVLVSIALEVGLDSEKLLLDLYDSTTLAELEAEIAYTIANGVSGFPSVVVYGLDNKSTILRGVATFDDYAKVIDQSKIARQTKEIYTLDNVLNKDHYLALREINDRLNLYFDNSAKEHFLNLAQKDEVLMVAINDSYYFKLKN